jgi:hypothetical protein
MANVTGQVGDKTVILDNAATEATLKLILEATRNGSKEQKDAVSQMAENAGLTVERVNESTETIGNFGLQVRKIGGAIGGLGAATEILYKRFSDFSSFFENIVEGTGKASSAIAPLEQLGPIIGSLATISRRLLQFQEIQVEQYQKLTDIGVNFAGSLTDLRLAAANAYLTMGEFTQVILENQEAFARMGKTSNDGAVAFGRLSNSLISSNLGANLMALGYTTYEINDQMAKYIQATGGRTQAEISSESGMKKLTQSTNIYLTELDALTQFTGVSKKKLEEDQKKAQMNEAFQRKMAGLGEEERLKLKLAYDKASASGIEGATDLVMSTALGLPPMTEASRMLTGVAGGAAQGLTEMTQVAMQSGTSTRDVNEKFVDSLISAKESAESYGTTADALSMQQGATSSVLNSLLGVENKLRAKGIETEADALAQQDEITKNQLKQQESQAKAAAETELAVKELGMNILNTLMPVFKVLLSVLNPLIQVLSAFFSLIAKSEILMAGLGLAVAALTIKFLDQKAAIGAAAAIKGLTTTGGIAGGLPPAGSLPGGGPSSMPGGPTPTVPPMPPGTGPTGPAASAGSGLRGLARGLRALGRPQTMLGVVTLGLLTGLMAGAALSLKQFADVSWESMAKGFLTLGGIGALSAVLALAAPIMGPASLSIALFGAALIPFGLAAMAAGKGIDMLGEGFKKLSEINNTALSGVAKTMSDVAVLALKLAPFALTGPAVAGSFKQIADSMIQLGNVNVVQLEKVANTMKLIKESSPGVTEVMSQGILGLASKFIPTGGIGQEAAKTQLATEKGLETIPTSTVTKQVESGINLIDELKRLNTITTEMLKTMKESTDLIKKNVDATKGLNKGLW